jgi:hypothetical protein
VVGLQLMGMMSVREMIARGVDPLKWSVSASRDLIRQAVQGYCPRRLNAQGWRNRLAACLKDAYLRTHDKKSRDWPDRKRERPPGPPQIRIASQKEVRKAQELLAKLHVA